ncbi:MAG: hypothetical protein HFJ44_01235 [Clostridia bacterium]|nr:hypothetical protein [Clostridia bacterium]
MRRKKKLIMNLLKILVVTLIVVGIYFIFKPKKKINTSKTNENNLEYIKVTTVDESNAKIELPEKIKDATTNIEIPKEEKKYTPLTKTSERYLVPILANNEVTILIGDDSEKLLSNNSIVQVGNEYTVSGIAETIQAVYYFTVNDYEYPILLLLGESGKLHYVDIEKSYRTGKFEISGSLKNITEVENVYQVNVEENGNSYHSAVIKCINGEGYEFNIDMIGK